MDTNTPEARPMHWILKRLKRFFRQRRRNTPTTITNIRF
jgi:hypothetical protein